MASGCRCPIQLRPGARLDEAIGQELTVYWITTLNVWIIIDVVCGMAIHNALDFLQIYYNVAGLVNKPGISRDSSWQLAENKASAKASKNKGACSHLADLLSCTAMLCVASNFSEQELNDIVTAHRNMAAVVYK